MTQKREEGGKSTGGQWAKDTSGSEARNIPTPSDVPAEIPAEVLDGIPAGVQALVTREELYEVYRSIRDAEGESSSETAALHQRVTDLEHGLDLAIAGIRYLEDQQAMPDNGYVSLYLDPALRIRGARS